MYYGDELGMTNVPIPEDRVQDPREKNVPGQGLNRDPERTPMQWNASENAGFTSGEPWLPLMENYREVNVEIQSGDPDSMLNFYRRLIRVRKGNKVLQIGDYVPVEAKGDMLSYIRERNQERYLVVLNLGDNQEEFRPHLDQWEGTVVVGTKASWEGKVVHNTIPMEPNLGLLIALNEK